MKTNAQDGRRHIPHHSYVFLPKLKHAGKCVEKLTQAKYESNARGEGCDLAPPPLCLRIQNSSKIQGLEK